MSESFITSHITIEEAEALGLIQIVKQLRINELTRKGLGLRTLQDEIENPTKYKKGRPKKIDSTRKLIRVNPNKLT
jgi:hypothetical protein